MGMGTGHEWVEYWSSSSFVGGYRAKESCIDNLRMLSGYSCPFKTPPERGNVLLFNKHKDGIMLLQSTLLQFGMGAITKTNNRYSDKLRSSLPLKRNTVASSSNPVGFTNYIVQIRA
jgi:hypothetical protein